MINANSKMIITMVATKDIPYHSFMFFFPQTSITPSEIITMAEKEFQIQVLWLENVSQKQFATSYVTSVEMYVG